MVVTARSEEKGHRIVKSINNTDGKKQVSFVVVGNIADEGAFDEVRSASPSSHQKILTKRNGNNRQSSLPTRRSTMSFTPHHPTAAEDEVMTTRLTDGAYALTDLRIPVVPLMAGSRQSLTGSSQCIW